MEFTPRPVRGGAGERDSENESENWMDEEYRFI